MSPGSADSNRRLEMVLYGPAAASSQQQRANMRARQQEAGANSSATATAPAPGAMVPHAGATPLDVAPISIVPHMLQPPPAAREAPPCLRRHFLVALGLRADLPVHYIDHKRVTSTDVDPHQNRFRFPSDGVRSRLRPILNPQELDAANLLLHDTPLLVPRKKRPRPDEPSEPQNSGTAEGEQPPGKKLKKKGKVHGGLRVKLVDLHAGAKELQMSRWDSSRGKVVKGEGYLDFIRRCSFREGDDVEIWAFVQRRLHLFGADVCNDSLLHVLVAKTKQQWPQCRYCPVQEE